MRLVRICGSPAISLWAQVLGDWHEADDAVEVRACLAGEDARCPNCGHPAKRVRSKYVRTLDDVPWAVASPVWCGNSIRDMIPGT